MITQIITGHANLRRHRFLMKLEEDPICECGEDEETSIHVITACPKYARIRHHYIGAVEIKADAIHKQKITDVINYAKATGKWTS